MSEVSQIAPRVASMAQARDGFEDWVDFRSGLLTVGFDTEEAEQIGGQLELDWSRPQSKFEVLAAVEAWVRFHDEFQTVEKKRRVPSSYRRRNYGNRRSQSGCPRSCTICYPPSSQQQL